MSHVRSNDPDVIQKLELRLAKARLRQSVMVAANKIARSKKLSPEDKRAQFCAIGANVNKHLTGYSLHDLANNRERIQRIIRRIEQIKSMKELNTADIKVDIPGLSPVVIVRNLEEYQVEVYLPSLPRRSGGRSLAAKKLASLGFRYSNTLAGWQRQLSPTALYCVRRFVREMGGPENVFKNVSQ